jgi:hypothetical protein
VRSSAAGARFFIEDLRRIATERVGTLVSTTWNGKRARVRFTCRFGHAFDASASSVRRGQWCPRCRRHSRWSIEDMRGLARARGGDCLSAQYSNAETKLRWRCGRGHVWTTAPKNVTSGSWCPECAIARRREASPCDIETMRQIARERGGRCLSSTYVTGEVHLEWQCALGHRWMATPTSVKRGRWCHECRGHYRLGLDDAERLAESRGGECLSTSFENSRSQLVWRCAHGHEFRLALGPARIGQWCPECRDEHPADRVLADARAFVHAHGGVVLSTRAVDAMSRLRFRRARGHDFRARLDEVRRIGFCPLCLAGVAPPTTQLRAS